MRVNRILVLGILLTYSAKLITKQELPDNTTNGEPPIDQENNISPENPEKKEETEPEESSGHESDKIKFGTSEFYLYILYSFRRLKSHLLLCWYDVRSDSWLLFYKPFES